ncbi:glial fibrillary acidic protein-like [Cucumis melo var. makuwa]|uniref:Glial fibrillary acidic protein-like n=1 Tax=Cucumis melo var. makuwa TaxID=1194695 RepID=A0A5D3BQ93_CUCMM|nr:glial fibrillary acidic protein-like [Cucumis melo var. makuwa]TYK01230.1 glial fibrillary acidic protein-like [Cucumis melo var. makuwa]
MRLYAIHQVQRLESYRSGVEFAIAPQSLDPNNVFRINHDDQEKNLKRLREMNQVLEPENEGLREEVNSKGEHKELKHELESVSKVFVDFQSALVEQGTSTQRITAGIEILQNSTKEYKIRITEEQCKNALLQEAVASSEHQLLICRNAREVVTEDHARLKNEHKEVLADFAIWRDEYNIMRHKYEDVKGQIEQGPKKLRHMARKADQFSTRTIALQQDIVPIQRGSRELSRFLGIIGHYLGCFGCYH